MSSKPGEPAAPNAASSEQDDVRFPYSLELVATIAAHFLDANTNEKQACERAIRLLNAARQTVQDEEVVMRSRKAYDQVPTELGFLEGIYWIVGYRREDDATKAFRDYLRINLRRARFQRELTRDDVRALLEPLPEGPAKDAEDSEIEKLMADFRANGFTSGELKGIKQQRDRWLREFEIPFRNSEKGKKGGRPKGSKKSQKKSLARISTPRSTD